MQVEDGPSSVTVLSHEEDAMSLFSPSIKQGKTYFPVKVLHSRIVTLKKSDIVGLLVFLFA